jgi:polyferredoxin
VERRQAVLFDLGPRRFYIFGLVLYPQDFIYLTGC